MVALGEADGMPLLGPLPGLTLVSAIPEVCRGAGRERPQVVPLNLMSAGAQLAVLVPVPGMLVGNKTPTGAHYRHVPSPQKFT